MERSDSGGVEWPAVGRLAMVLDLLFLPLSAQSEQL